MFDVPVLQLHHPDGQVFRFDPGSLALAFAVTGAPIDSRFETLIEPDDLARWANDVLAVATIRTSGADLDATKRLRAAIWSSVDAVIDGATIPIPDRETINAAAAQPGLVPELTDDGRQAWRHDATASALLSTIARDAIDVVAGPRAARLRRCQARRCAIPFVDTSRPGARLWCLMDRCGNRAKVAAHRRRQRQEEPG